MRRHRLRRRAGVGGCHGDSEVVRLSETGANTGVFVGYLATATGAAGNDCTLQVSAIPGWTQPTSIRPMAATRAQADALVDPFGMVFDSQTGLPLNGARVRLIDATTGLAAVFGDDGVVTVSPVKWSSVSR
jgi:hypothetical protein